MEILIGVTRLLDPANPWQRLSCPRRFALYSPQPSVGSTPLSPHSIARETQILKGGSIPQRGGKWHYLLRAASYDLLNSELAAESFDRCFRSVLPNSANICRLSSGFRHPRSRHIRHLSSHGDLQSTTEYHCDRRLPHLPSAQSPGRGPARSSPAEAG